MISGINKAWLLLTASLVFCNYYYLYFYEFDQGEVVQASPYVYSIRIAGLVLFYSLILSPKLKFKYRLVDIFLIASLVFFILILIIKRANWSLGGGYKVFNLYICLVPFLFFEMNKNIGRVYYFLDACLLILVLQIFIDSSIYISGNSLWENKAFIGGFGNASGFGIMCSIFLAYNLYLKPNGWMKAFVSTILLYGIMMTSSMMALFMGGWVVMSYFWSLNRSYFVLAAILIGLLFLFFYETFLTEHVLYKIESLLFLSEEGSSRSVSLRVENYAYFIQQLLSDYMRTFLYGYNGSYGYIADSQYLTNIGSYGLLGSLVFFGSVARYGVIAYKAKGRFNEFTVLVIGVFFLVFFTNRILDYYPLPLILFLILFTSDRLSRRVV